MAAAGSAAAVTPAPVGLDRVLDPALHHRVQPFLVADDGEVVVGTVALVPAPDVQIGSVVRVGSHLDPPRVDQRTPQLVAVGVPAEDGVEDDQVSGELTDVDVAGVAAVDVDGDPRHFLAQVVALGVVHVVHQGNLAVDARLAAHAEGLVARGAHVGAYDDVGVVELGRTDVVAEDRLSTAARRNAGEGGEPRHHGEVVERRSGAVIQVSDDPDEVALAPGGGGEHVGLQRLRDRVRHGRGVVHGDRVGDGLREGDRLAVTGRQAGDEGHREDGDQETLHGFTPGVHGCPVWAGRQAENPLCLTEYTTKVLRKAQCDV